MKQRRAEGTRVGAVLLDVGGTLWWSGWSETDAIRSTRMRRIQAVIAEFTSETAETFHARLMEAMSERMRLAWRDRSYAQDTAGVIRRVGQEFGLPPGPATVRAVRRARRVSPLGHVEPFPGALDLLSLIRSRDLRCVAVSNADWRGSEEYQADFVDLGLDAYFDAIVTSLDVGFVKPHPAMFEAAAAAVGCDTAACVMTGNKESSDITPAAALGMRTILVAIETPRPEASRADAVVESLTEAADVLRAWIDV